MAMVGAALGSQSNRLLFTCIVFTWQRTATMQRPIRFLDTQLDGVALVVLDAARWVRGGSAELCCPACGAKDPKDNGFSHNATSSKGFGDCHVPLEQAARVPG